MTRCGVYYRLGRVFLTIPRWSKEEFQLSVFFSEVANLQCDVMGAEVRRALETVRVEKDKTWSNRKLDAQSAKLHDVAGTKGWSEFVHGAAHVGIEQERGLIVVIPSVNAGSREGFLYTQEDQWLRLEDPAEAELGEAVLKGLKRSGAELGGPAGA